MTDVPKEKIIARLRQAIAEIEGLDGETYDSPDHQQWERRTSVAIAHLFGKDSGHVSEFQHVRFFPGAIGSDTPESVYREAYDDGLVNAKKLLEAMIEEVEEFWDDKAKAKPEPSTRSVDVEPKPESSSIVWVVHGRDDRANTAMFEFLRSIGLRPLEWSQAVAKTGKSLPSIQEILDTAFQNAGAVLVLMTPDDEARLREKYRQRNDPPHEIELTPQARPNVLFEAGMVFGRSPERTVLVEFGDLRPFTDIAGLHVIRMDNTSQRRQELAQRLRAAGCPVDLTGTDWHTAGDFKPTLVIRTLELDVPGSKR